MSKKDIVRLWREYAAATKRLETCSVRDRPRAYIREHAAYARMTWERARIAPTKSGKDFWRRQCVIDEHVLLHLRILEQLFKEFEDE